MLGRTRPKAEAPVLEKGQEQRETREEKTA